MVDFHSHILFGVDDGSTDFEMSVKMIETSISEGVTILAATPHHIPDEFETGRAEYEEKFNRLKEKFQGKIELIPSVEIMINRNLLGDLKEGKIFGYGHSKTLLIEFNLLDFPTYAEGLFYKLKKEGYQVILAHPERNKALREDPEEIYHLIDLGVQCQMNAGSLAGHFGEKNKAFAEKLVLKNLIHAIGSDGHNDAKRSTRIKFAYDRVKEMNPELYAHIIKTSPKIIKGETCEPLAYKSWEDTTRKKGRGILGLFRK